MFDQEEFNNFVIDKKVLGFFDQPITLVSGRESCWYFNWRDIASDVFLLDRLSDFLLSFVADKQIELDCFYGTPDGATKLAVVSQYKWAQTQANYGESSHVLPMGRKKPKDHGAAKDRYFVGEPKGKIVVLEDVTTTGGSLLDTVKQLQSLDKQVVAAIALTNRNALMNDRIHVSQALEEIGVEYYAMANALDLLPRIVSLQRPPDSIRTSIIQEFDQFGVEAIQL